MNAHVKLKSQKDLNILNDSIKDKQSLHNSFSFQNNDRTITKKFSKEKQINQKTNLLPPLNSENDLNKIQLQLNNYIEITQNNKTENFLKLPLKTIVEEKTILNSEIDPKMKSESVIDISIINEQKLSLYDRDSIRAILVQHYLFKEIEKEIISILINEFKKIKFDSEKYIFTEENLSEYFYIIKKGKVSETNKYETKIYKDGETFSEISLMEKKQYRSNVKCINDTICYILEGQKFREIVYKLNSDQLKERLNFLSLVPIFKCMNIKQLSCIILSMLPCFYDINQKIIKEGEIGYSLYIIKKGEVSCETKNKTIRKLGEKDFFGEYALLFDLPRSLTVKAKTKVNVFEISNTLLEEALGKDYKCVILRSILKESFKNDNILSVISEDSYIYEILENSEIVSLNDGKLIEMENNKECDMKDENKILYCIIIGNFINKKKHIIAKRGELFGSNYLENKNNINNNKKVNKEYKEVYAQGECRVIKILWKNIMKCLGITDKNTEIFSFFEHLNLMKKNKLFEKVSNSKLIKICSVMQKEKFKPNEYIFKENTPANKFYMIIKGTVIIWKNNKNIREVGKGSCFGEIALLKNQLRSATLQAKEECILYVLKKEDFDKNIDTNMLEYLNNKMALQDDNKTLNSIYDFYYCKKLGQGKFGEVSLIHNKKYFYAIKCINKKTAEKQKMLIKYFLAERRLLLTLDNPFIMKLVKTFKTDNLIFYLNEYINGQLFSDYLFYRTEESLHNKTELQFYISLLFLALDYLNSKNIAHRDLKPDNIMINNSGYIKIIDFGTAKIIKDFTYTMTGTPYYIGPEVLKGKGYSFSCDYWSIGIIAYEIYYNCYPFGNEATDPMEIYKDTIKKDLAFPYKGDKCVNNFIKAILTKNVTKRLCSLEAAKKNEFFKNVNWNDLIDLQIEAPYIPSVTPDLNFDDYNEKYVDHLEKKENIESEKNDTEFLYDDNDLSDSSLLNWADEF